MGSSSNHPGVILQMQLSINNLSMRFGALVLFEDVNTTFISGRRYAITGPNGAGKSTLMKILNGEIDPEKGSVTRPRGMPDCGKPCKSAKSSTRRIPTR